MQELQDNEKLFQMEREKGKSSYIQIIFRINRSKGNLRLRKKTDLEIYRHYVKINNFDKLLIL